MTAVEQARGPSKPHPLLRGASPAVIRAWLLPEDQNRFAAEYEAAIDEARRTFELAPVQSMVERWRQIAVTQSNPAAFRTAVRRWAEIVTGEPVPEDEPFDVTRAKAGM